MAAGPGPRGAASRAASGVRALVGRIRDSVEGVSAYLQGVVLANRGLPARSFYGESFTALLLGGRPSTDPEALNLLYAGYRAKDREHPEFHWEFNNYAWISLYREQGDPAAAGFVEPLRFRNTPVTNWTLLRSCTRQLAGKEQDQARREAAGVLRRLQLRSGLICDQPHVRSFQYHCFSTVLVAELHALDGRPWFLERFRRAVEFIVPFVLRTGDTLYVGRGQEQSFGYGALVYLLALAFHRFREGRYLACLERVVGFLERRRRQDGSFPLVLNDMEEGYPLAASQSDERFPGWYAYNNYFDYLPFFGVFLKKTERVLSGLQDIDAAPAAPAGGYRDGNFIVVRRSGYEAVLARPGGGWRGGDGYWTNDLPVPYVCRGGVRLTPSYGGEQFHSALYSPAGIPLPMVVGKGREAYFRDGRIWSFFLGRLLVVITPRGLLVRRFRFLDAAIVIDDWMIAPGKTFARYLFDEVAAVGERSCVIRGGARVESSIPMSVARSGEHYWGGRLWSLVGKAAGRRCTIAIRWD